MNVFGKDMIIGNFKLSDYGLMLASMESSGGEDDLGSDYETVEEFVGSRPVPVYIGAKYSNKLKPKITIVKNPCTNEDISFTEHECREILRSLTGFRGYKLMQIYLDEVDELYYFNVRVNKSSYYKIGNSVTAIILSMECDSQFAWSKEYKYIYEVSKDKNLVFFNTSDDLENYLLPFITIKAKSSIDVLNITNIMDNDWKTTIKNVSKDEIITMDSKNQIIKSSKSGRPYMLDDFNLHFIRFCNGKNELTVDTDCTIMLKFRFPRKVGFL